VSSNAYFAELHPEPKLRVIVLLSGLIACLAGFLLVLSLPLGVWQRAFIVCGWVVLCGREMVQTWRGYAMSSALRISGDACIEVRLVGGEWRTASLLPGSLVLPGVAWLRISVGAGPAYGELLTGNSRKNKDWRRLLVIWRHIGAAN
jgi:hypothetical protein